MGKASRRRRLSQRGESLFGEEQGQSLLFGRALPVFDLLDLLKVWAHHSLLANIHLLIDVGFSPSVTFFLI